MSFYDYGVVMFRFGRSRITSHPAILLYLISWLREDYDLLTNMETYLGYVEAFIGFSMLHFS